MKQPETKNQQAIEDVQTPLGVEDGGCPRYGCWISKGEEREKRKRGCGLFKRGVGLLVEVPRDLREGLFK